MAVSAALLMRVVKIMASDSGASTSSWPGAWRHFGGSWVWSRRRPAAGHPYCFVHQSAWDIADVHDLAAGSGPMVALEAWQEGRCALCGGEVPLRWTVADHCHTTGWVRGLLCISCNKLESHPPRSIRDPDRAQALVRYRAHPPTRLLGLRVQYRDVRAGWRFACAARHQAELDRLLAELEAQELRRAAPSPGMKAAAPAYLPSNVPASGPA
ncbi:endonuclease domain-containing protein [Actinophytocola sediminis]